MRIRRETLERQHQAMIRLVARHPLWTTALTAVYLGWMAQLHLFFDEPVRGWSFWGWLAVAAMAYAAIIIPTLPRAAKRTAADVTVERYGIALSVFLFGFASRFDGASWWLLWLPLAETVALVAFTAFATARDSRARGLDPKPSSEEDL